MAAAPSKIRVHSGEKKLELEWPDSPGVLVPLRTVRLQCPCARCVHEITGERLLDPDRVPIDVYAAGVSFVGNYALKIVWSDGDSSGLYTWELLRKIADEHRASVG
jgi:DUF971 family protein